MQYQQTSDLQNGSIASAQPGGNSPNSPPGSYGMVPGTKRALINGGRFDFEDGGTYCGGWEEGKAHGFGVCTGPKHQGAYAGAWNYGFEVSGVYIWPSGSSFEGQWQNGRRHGLGVEQRGRLVYRGEWTSGYKGRYGVRQSTTSTAKYEGTWANGLQDGYGSETYADGGSYQGQWQEGKRHGYGVRTSAPYGLASHYRPKPAVHTSMSSLNNENADPSDKRNHRMEDIRGGFVLRAKSDDEPTRRNSLGEKSKKGLFSGLKMRKQRSVGDLEKRGTAASGSIRSTVSTASWISTGSSQSVLSQKSIHSESNASFTLDDEQLDPSVVETYIGEWKRDKRDGYGISERSDGLKYEGEWHNNKKHGYGVTTFRDGTKEEGKYKNNILITSNKKKHLFLIRSRKFRERIEASIQAAQRALKYALQKADIAISRTTTARSKAEFADEAADKARVDCEGAVSTAREFAPDFKPSVLERFERLRFRERIRAQPSDDPILPTIKHGQLQKSSLSNQNLGNTLDASSLNRKPSMIPPSTFDNPQVPSTMYSQQISPRTDLTQHISKIQQYEHQRQQQHRTHQMNPSSTYQNQLQQSSSTLTQPLQTSLAVNETSDNYIGGSSLNLNQQLKQLVQQPNTNQSLENNFVNRNQTYLDYGNLTEQNYTNPSQQKQQQLNMDQIQIHNSLPGSGTNIRRNSRPVNQSVKPMLGEMGQQSSIDHFDHYKRPPSRDNSVDRYTRAASRLSGQSRQPSVDRNISVVPTLNNTTSSDDTTPNRNVRASSQFRGATPAPQTSTGNGSIPTGNGSISASIGISQFSTRTGGQKAMYSSPNQPFEDVLLRQRTLGQDIIPSPSQPKRTESLFVPPKPISNVKAGGNSGIAGKIKLKSVPINVTLQRKKSLPDFQELPIATSMMSREEVSALGSARREEVRRQVELNERLKANPLLYLVSPQIKDWFSRQQLVLLVLIVNVVLAIMFFKMLT